VTALTARRVRHGVGARVICQPDPPPGISARSSPPLFQRPSPSFLPLHFPARAPLRASVLNELHPPVRAPPASARRPVPTSIYAAASGKRLQHERRLLFARRPGSTFPSTVPTAGLALDGDADEGSGFSSSPATPPSSPVTESVTSPSISTMVAQAASGPLTGCLTTASSFADLHHGLVLYVGAGKEVEDRRRLRCDKANGENAACLARAPARGRRRGSLDQAHNSH
jgi:hypothetical protein